MANWTQDNDDAERAANHYGSYSQNNPWIVEDIDGTLWDETTGLPIRSNRERYYTPGG